MVGSSGNTNDCVILITEANQNTKYTIYTFIANIILFTIKYRIV